MDIDQRVQYQNKTIYTPGNTGPVGLVFTQQSLATTCPDAQPRYDNTFIKQGSKVNGKSELNYIIPPRIAKIGIKVQDVHVPDKLMVPILTTLSDVNYERKASAFGLQRNENQFRRMPFGGYEAIYQNGIGPRIVSIAGGDPFIVGPSPNAPSYYPVPNLKV